MRRLIALILALVLPLQLSWAVAGEYCQHESTPMSAHHFGHHEHAHHVGDKKAPGKAALDTDCGFCHAGVPVALATSEPHVAVVQLPDFLVIVTPLDHSSALARAPDRPQWLRLA